MNSISIDLPLSLEHVPLAAAPVVPSRAMTHLSVPNPDVGGFERELSALLEDSSTQDHEPIPLAAAPPASPLAGSNLPPSGIGLPIPATSEHPAPDGAGPAPEQRAIANLPGLSPAPLPIRHDLAALPATQPLLPLPLDAKDVAIGVAGMERPVAASNLPVPLNPAKTQTAAQSALVPSAGNDAATLRQNVETMLSATTATATAAVTTAAVITGDALSETAAQPAPSLTTGPVAQAASAPAITPHPPGEPRVEARIAPQIDTAIEQLAETREIGRAARPEIVMRHGEFGLVTMRLDAAGGDLRATLAARDPGFVPAVQAALAERAVAATSDPASTSGQRGSEQPPGSGAGANGAGTGSGQGFSQNYGSSLGSAQTSSQPRLHHHDEAPREHDDRATQDAAGALSAAAGQRGIFA